MVLVLVAPTSWRQGRGKVAPALDAEVAIRRSNRRPAARARCEQLFSVNIGANRVREQLNACLRLETLADLEAKVNAALAERLPRKVRRAAGELAIDLHDQPYYGQEDALTCRGEAKAGTTRWYRVATARLPRGRRPEDQPRMARQGLCQHPRVPAAGSATS